MKDKGFMLVDSLLAMLIFGIIISVLMPAVMMLEQTMTESEETLEFKDVRLSEVHVDGSGFLCWSEFFVLVSIHIDEHQTQFVKIC